MALSSDEKVRIRQHLGFPQVHTMVTVALGIPAGGHPTFILEDTMDKLRPESEAVVREILAECDRIECQLKEARSRLAVSSVGGVDLRGPEEITALWDLYQLWTDKLVDVFGVNKQPFSKAHQRLDGQIMVVGDGF